MPTSILATKLYIPPPRSKVVSRPRLIERLNEGLHRKLTLISTAAGFGKTTLTSEWVASCQRPVAWLSLDEGDNDLARFLVYLIAALQTIIPSIGAGILGVLQSPQTPPTESIMTDLLNEITTVSDDFVLVLDDYHLIDSKPVDEALTLIIKRLPPQMHLVITTREDPHLPLALLRAQGQLTELRAADLRFTPTEAAEFLNQVMGLDLSAEDVTSLEARTEGWIAGLQLAALSMQGHRDTAGFITSFTGSHRFVLDYLVEEVLHQQSESIQTFLLRTSILERLCGPLCDAVLGSPSPSGQNTLEYLEHANLFIVPLDNERHWYRYHHLFGELLRQRLQQSGALAEYHIRASEWYEANGFELEAFHHAGTANDIARAERLLDGKGMPLHFRGMVAPVLNWLDSLPKAVLDAIPSLWTAYASALLVSGHGAAAEQKLQAAEAALQGGGSLTRTEREPGDRTRDTLGRIAAIRSTLAIYRYETEECIAYSQRALEYLHPDNVSFRTFTIWKLGFAYHLQGNRIAAKQAYTEAIAISQATGNLVTTIAALIGLGRLQESDNQLYVAAQTYQRVLHLCGEHPLPVADQAYLGLARIYYEWNDLDTAQQHAQRCLQLARQAENTDRYVTCEVFLARLKFAQGDTDGAAEVLSQAEQSVRQHNFVRRIPEVAEAKIPVLLHQGNLAAAAQLAKSHELPMSQSRVYLAQGNSSAALVVLAPLRQQMEARGWLDKQLNIMVLQAVALYVHGEKGKAVQLLSEVLTIAEPGGFIRLIVDEGQPMAQLLSEAAVRGVMPDNIGKLLAAFDAAKPPVTADQKTDPGKSTVISPAQPLIEPLSQREIKILELIALGLSNRVISERLYLALSTVKGHNRIIFDKLQVTNRTEAVARARELSLI